MANRSAIAVKSSRSGERRPIGRAFFARDTVRVARALLGTEFGATGPEGSRSVRLVETEAYVRGDPASHAFRGPTARNRSMFQAPGTLYVYRIHQVVCANLVTRPGEAVLLRAGEPLRPGMGSPSGPGRLCRALGITLADDGVDVLSSSRFFLRRSEELRDRILVGRRVGIRRAARRRLRFARASSPWVSRPRPTGWRAAIAASPSRTRGGARSRRNRRRSRRPSDGGKSAGRTVGR
jgi:DNA-3-methyladenine glycosylase